MATRRRSRRKTIAGNITDVQKRLRYLETRPAPTRLASKAVATKNISLRAVEEELIADSAITRRALTNGVVGTDQIEASSITAALIGTNAVGTDQIAPDSVTANEIAPGTITSAEMGTDSVTSTQIQNGSVGTDELAGGIPDSKISGMSSSKLIGQIQDDQIAGITGSKIIGGVDGALIVNGSITEGKIASLPTTKLTGTITNDQLAGSIQAIKIAGVSSSVLIGEVPQVSIPLIPANKITGGPFVPSLIPLITNAMLAGGITNGKIASVDAATITTGVIGSVNRLPAEVLTDVNGGTGITVAGTGRTRTVSMTGSYALTSHTHSTYAAAGRYDTSFAGSHVGHGGHTHFTNITSSRKLKKEISDYSIDLDKLFLLKPKRFKYRNQARMASKNREWDYGYIAEEAVEMGVEEIVGYDENGEVDSINYGLLSVFVLELVKKQQSEIDLLSKEIERLKENR